MPAALAAVLPGLAVLICAGSAALSPSLCGAECESHDDGAVLLQSRTQVGGARAAGAVAEAPAQWTARAAGVLHDGAVTFAEAALVSVHGTTHEWSMPGEPGEGARAAEAVSVAIPRWCWGALIATCAALYAADMLVLQRAPDSFPAHVALLAFWFVAAWVFETGLRLGSVPVGTMGWWPAYFMEWALSSDDQFAFYAVHRKYRTPRSQVHYGMFVGLPVAIAVRFLLYISLAGLFHYFAWLRVVFGALLVLGGLQTISSWGSEEAGAEDVSDDSWVVMVLKSCLGGRAASDFGAQPSLFRTSSSGRWQAMPMLVVVTTVELTAAVCSIDSARAKLMQFPSLFLAFSSAAIAMFGIRSFFLVFMDVVEAFSFLRYFVAIFLIYLGANIIFVQSMNLPDAMLFIFVGAAVGAAVILPVLVQFALRKHSVEKPARMKPDHALAAGAKGEIAETGGS